MPEVEQEVLNGRGNISSARQIDAGRIMDPAHAVIGIEIEPGHTPSVAVAHVCKPQHNTVRADRFR